MSNLETEIFSALLDHLAAGFVALPIAYPNVQFDPPESGYAEAKIFRDPAYQAALGASGYNRHSGYLQVGIYRPLNEGVVVAMNYAGDIATLFKRGTTLSTASTIVRINEPPSIRNGLDVPPYTIVPIVIPYIADGPNG